MTMSSHVHMYSDLICAVKVQTLQAERNKYVFKRDIDDDSDGAPLRSFGIEFQTEEDANEIERSPSVALLCARLLSRGMVGDCGDCCGL